MTIALPSTQVAKYEVAASDGHSSYNNYYVSYRLPIFVKFCCNFFNIYDYKFPY